MDDEWGPEGSLFTGDTAIDGFVREVMKQNPGLDGKYVGTTDESYRSMLCDAAGDILWDYIGEKLGIPEEPLPNREEVLANSRLTIEKLVGTL